MVVWEIPCESRTSPDTQINNPKVNALGFFRLRLADVLRSHGESREKRIIDNMNSFMLAAFFPNELFEFVGLSQTPN